MIKNNFNNQLKLLISILITSNLGDITFYQ